MKIDYINIKDNNVGTQLLDKLTRIKSSRRIKPLTRIENIIYTHSVYYNEYNLQLGDCTFMIPPEFIMISSESTTNSIVTLRQENTRKQKLGHRRKTILIDLVFSGINQINGFKVNGPEGVYYVDGLRQLLAQFKCAPFLPIRNELINRTYGIFNVALQAINISTIIGFPNVIKAQITLQEVNLFPYLQMPDICFHDMIDWDLFRFYYQRFLTEDHEYKKLQSLPENKEENRFKLSILDDNIFSEANEFNILEIVTDKTILRKNEDGSLANTNYISWVDNQNANISSFQCGYSNILTNLQLQDMSTPTLQYLGGLDTIFNITFETKDKKLIQSLNQLQTTNDAMIRNNPKHQSSLGFIKLESELVQFVGSLFVMIDSLQIATAPDFPELYSVQINCVSYDIAQDIREDLHGFRPFNDYLNTGTGTTQSKAYLSEVIEQNKSGLRRKIRQDAYAENKYLNMEMYPDLYLPTYDEVNTVINKIINFRRLNNLPELPYSKYPTRPMNIIHGSKYYANQNINTNKNILDLNDIQQIDYEGYVDPDFYVFYPGSYNSFFQEDSSYYGEHTGKLKPSTKTVTTYEYSTQDQDGGINLNSTDLDKFIQIALSKVGCEYEFGSVGTINNITGKEEFDCSGLVSYCLNAVNISSTRFTTKGFALHPETFTEVNLSDRQKGDILWRDGHCAIYLGDNKIVHARGEKYGVLTNNLNEVGAFTKCYRINAFKNSNSNSPSTQQVSNNNSSSTVISPTTSDGSLDGNAKYIYQFFKGKGFNDIAIAGMLGNMQYESGVSTTNIENSRETSSLNDSNYTQKVDSGSYNDFVDDGIGYGIVQFTYSGYKRDLLNKAKSKKVSISDLETQCEVLYDAVVNMKSSLNNCATPEDAAFLFLKDYEKPKNPNSTANIRKQYAAEMLNRISGYSSTTVVNNPSTGGNYMISQTEFDNICRCVYGNTLGQGQDSIKAFSQMIYDKLTSGNSGGLTTILNGIGNSSGTYNQAVKDAVTGVFVNNDKVFSNTINYYISTSSTGQDAARLDSYYQRLGTVGKFIYWSDKTQSSDIRYTITGSTLPTQTSSDAKLIQTTQPIDALEKENIDKFGEPLFIKSDVIDKSSFKDEWKKIVNDSNNILNTSFVNEYQYSCRGSLLKAFPTFLFCILDDQAQWFDGKKLWTNFYTYKSVVDIQVHSTNDMATQTASIFINNSCGNLNEKQKGLYNYKLENDDEYWYSGIGGVGIGKFKIGNLHRWLYKTTGVSFGFGPKLTSTLIKMRQVIYTSAKLREGTRIHLRMGYGSDPLSLAPMINGSISAISIGDQIQMEVTSDGNELIAGIVGTNKNASNNGFLGLFGLFENQESSNIIADVFCCRESWVNLIFNRAFEANKYHIEHYGLFDQDEYGIIDNGLIGTATKDYTKQHDILMNVYKATYKGDLYTHGGFLWFDGEENIVFKNYNMTPWDMCQTLTQNTPEFIVKSVYHQFDSRIFFGLPFYQERYRYDMIGDTVYEECKSASQIHFLDSMENIIDNQIKVTGRFTNTNVKVMYVRGGDSVTTSVIHSDDTIDNSKQKTQILDSPVCQDALGIDFIWETTFYKVGANAARRIGISNLIYGWQQQYQGSIICTGLPGINPHDHIMISDFYSNTFGIAIVRETIHSLNTQTGFTTSIIPGMCAFSTANESGAMEMSKNYLMLLNMFIKYIYTRRGMYKNYEKNLSTFSELEAARNAAEGLYKHYALLNSPIVKYGAPVVSGIANAAIDVAILAQTGYTIVQAGNYLFRAAKYAYQVRNFGQLLQEGWTAIKTTVNTFKTIRGIAVSIKSGSIIGAIMGGSVTLAPATGGLSVIIGGLLSLAITILFDTILNAVIEYFENKNVIKILPLWWENYPLACNWKDGEKILLINPGEDQVDNGVD